MTSKQQILDGPRVPAVPDVPASQTNSLYQKKDTVAKKENTLDAFSSGENKVSNSGTDGTSGTQDGLVKGAVDVLNGTSSGRREP